MDSRALEFWEIDGNPFLPMPLTFERGLDFDYLVKGQTINKIKDKYIQYIKDNNYKIYIVKGQRGSGKTTALKYFEYIANKDSKLTKSKVVFFSLIGEGGSEFNKRSIHEQILITLEKSLKNDEILINAYNQYKSEKATSNEIEYIDSNIIDITTIFSRSYERVALIFDDLDKVVDAEEQMKILNYLKSNQSFFTKIISVRSAMYIFFAMHSYLASLIEFNREFSYFGKDSIEIENWNKGDLDNLVKQRLMNKYINGKENFKLYSFFDPDALEEIYKAAQGSPREVMNICLKTMETSFDRSDPSKNKIYKPIRRHFIQKFIDDIKIEEMSGIDFSMVKTKLIKHHFEAFTEIQECLRSNPFHAFEIARTLMKYTNNTPESEISTKINAIMEKYAIIEKRDNKYGLRQDIVKLIKFLKHENFTDEIIPRFFVESGM